MHCINCLLSEESAIELTYLLCATPLQAYRRARALLQLPSDDRLAVHNFDVGHAHGETFMERWGPEIMGLPVPLFPAGRCHEDTNAKLLAQMSLYVTTVKGAGETRRPKFSIFAKQAPIHAAGHKVAVEDGAVDLGIVEEEFGLVGQKFANVAARIEALEAAQRSRGRGRGTGRSRGRGANYNNDYYEPQAQQAYNNSYSQYPNNNYHNNQYRGGRGNRGGYVRGRGPSDLHEGNEEGQVGEPN